jgi:hypothetical protein
MGGSENVERFLNWVKPVNGVLYAYLHVRDCSPAFLTGDKPYFDIVTAGMYAALLRKVNRSNDPAIVGASRAYAKALTPEGGYRWGLLANGGAVDGGAQALVTGYWGQYTTIT